MIYQPMEFQPNHGPIATGVWCLPCVLGTVQGSCANIVPQPQPCLALWPLRLAYGVGLGYSSVRHAREIAQVYDSDLVAILSFDLHLFPTSKLLEHTIYIHGFGLKI